jgi:hypothetical protein
MWVSATLVADEGRNELEQDAVVGQHRGDAQHVRSRADRGRLAADPFPAEPDIEIDDAASPTHPPSVSRAPKTTVCDAPLFGRLGSGTAPAFARSRALCRICSPGGAWGLVVRSLWFIASLLRVGGGSCAAPAAAPTTGPPPAPIEQRLSAPRPCRRRKLASGYRHRPRQPTVQTLRRLADALETHLVIGFADQIIALGDPLGIDARAADLIAVG